MIPRSLIVLAALWYFYATDLNSASRIAAKVGGYESQATCEQMAERAHREGSGLLVHLLSVRRVPGGQYQVACFASEPDATVIVVPTK